MDPILIYFNNLNFNENHRFILNFSDGDILKGVNFSKENNYYIMSMSCFVEVSNEITELKQYDNIKKKSIIANRYIRNRIDYGFDSTEIEIIFDKKTYQFEINKISRSKAVDIYSFYDHLLKRKRFAIVYLSYKDFVENGITYKEKNTSNNISGYTVKLIKKNNKDFIQKEICFNKSRLVSKIKKKNDDKNMIFLKYHNKIYPFKLEITEPFVAKFSDAADKRNSYKFLFDILFLSPIDTKKFMFVKNKVFLSSRYPSHISLKELTLLGEVDVYLSDALYSNKKLFLTNVPETGAIDLNSNLLSFF